MNLELFFALAWISAQSNEKRIFTVCNLCKSLYKLWLDGGGGCFLSTCNRDKIQEFFFCLQELEKFSDIDLVVFVVENADEVRLIYFS